ncbi:MAG: trimethylamine methyltransferase family protein [Deltaproteobacteria bacterium]|nr:trimethylamine methyltransferase family protein [Deltaproteobacteria bacterium]
MSAKGPKAARRRGRAARMTVREQAQSKRAQVVWPGVESGWIKPLNDRALERINEGALQVLERIGMAGAGPEITEIAREKGLTITDDDRILFSRAYIEDMVAGAARNFTLYGRERKYDFELSGSKVHFGTAGAAVSATGTTSRGSPIACRTSTGSGAPWRRPRWKAGSTWT